MEPSSLVAEKLAERKSNLMKECPRMAELREVQDEQRKIPQEILELEGWDEKHDSH